MGRKGFRGRGTYLQWTTTGPALAAVSGLSSTSATSRSRGPADSGVWWSGQAEKRMCFTDRRSSWCWAGTKRENRGRMRALPVLFSGAGAAVTRAEDASLVQLTVRHRPLLGRSLGSAERPKFKSWLCLQPARGFG